MLAISTDSYILTLLMYSRRKFLSLRRTTRSTLTYMAPYTNTLYNGVSSLHQIRGDR